MKYGIDICSYQGKPNWAKVKKAGCGFAVLKCIRKNLAADTSFAYNVQGCAAQKIPVSVYTYVYENTPDGAVKRAKAAVKSCVAHGVKNCVIWWDVEERSVFKTGAAARAKATASILAACKVIEAAGYGFGVYCDADFYTGMLNAQDIGGKWWIASYGPNRVTTFGQKPDRKKPTIRNELCGWQYCSKGRVPGISGAVDLDVAYDDHFASAVKKAAVDGISTRKRTVTNAAGANLRELPSGEAAVVATAQKGAELAVVEDWTATNTVGSDTRYVCVNYAGKWLWCAEKLLE